MFKIFGNSQKPKVTEKMLIEAKIPIFKKEDIYLDKSQFITTVGSGKYYKGKYKGIPVSIKIVNILKYDLITNEFLFWKAYNNNNNILQLKGVCLYKESAYIVLEDFVCTLQYALKNKKINKKNKIDVAIEAFNIVNTFVGDNKKLLDIRPGIFGITESGKLKLLDFCILIIPDEIINNSEIIIERLKYAPPEYYNKNEDLNYDIWSFGCLLIDIFSENSIILNKIVDSKLEAESIIKSIKKGNFPIIPKGRLDPIIQNIIMKCLKINQEERIKIKE